MYFKKESLEKFQTIYDDYFLQKIDENETYQKATKLVQFIKLVYKPMIKEQHETYKNAHIKH